MSTIYNMGIPEVGAGIMQPKAKNRWRVFFVNLGADGSNSLPLSHQLVTFTRPKLNFGKMEVHRYNSVAYLATKHQWETVNITLEDDVNGSASKLVNDQISQQQFLIGSEGPFMGAAQEGSIYKFGMKCEQLDGKEQVIERWNIEGCWIENNDWGELDYADGNALTITLTVSIDHAWQEIGGYNAGEGIAIGGSTS